MKTLLPVIVLMCLFVLPAKSQNTADIQFKVKHYDFGTIRPEDGVATYRFMFENKGDAPLLIDTVIATCGCASTDWIQTPVAPGESGFVEIAYDPYNRMGKFNKSMTVRSNAKRKEVKLEISGYVKAPAATVELRYPEKIGDLRLEKKALHMGKITNEKPQTSIIPVYNDGDQILIFADSFKADDHIELKFFPETLRPGREGQVHVIYDAQKKDDYGFLNDQVVFYTDEKENREKALSVMAVVFQYIPPQTPEMLSEAPRIGFSKTNHNFRNVKEGEVYQTQFTISNFGRSPLKIYRIKSNCECLTFNQSNETLKPGENMELQVELNTANRMGLEQKEIIVYSNDPRTPVKSFKIKAYVE